MIAKFVHENVVHFGIRVDTEHDGSAVYFLCERRKLLGVLYRGGRVEHEDPPMYEPGVEVFHVFDDVDCMACLVAEGRRRGGS